MDGQMTFSARNGSKNHLFLKQQHVILLGHLSWLSMMVTAHIQLKKCKNLLKKIILNYSAFHCIRCTAHSPWMSVFLAPCNTGGWNDVMKSWTRWVRRSGRWTSSENTWLQENRHSYLEPFKRHGKSVASAHLNQTSSLMPTSCQAPACQHVVTSPPVIQSLMTTQIWRQL